MQGQAPIRHTGFPQVAIVLSGEGSLLFEGGQMPIRQADELFFPYDIPDFRVQGDVKLILCNPEGVRF